MKLTTVVPVPLAGSVTQAEFELAVHAQVGELIVNVTLPEPPEASMTTPLVDKLEVQPLAWLKVTVWPATVSEPVRAGPLLAATLYVALWVPVPLVGEIASQLSLLDAVHGHAALLAVIVRLPEPAAAVGETLVGDTVNVQPLAWLTVNVCPAMVSVPLRATPVLAATV